MNYEFLFVIKFDFMIFMLEMNELSQMYHERMKVKMYHVIMLL